MKAMVGSTILSSSYDAGIELAKNSTKGLRNPKIGFLFGSTKYTQAELLRGVKSFNPDIKIIGCTSNEAVMTSDGIIWNEDGFAGMMALEDNELTVGVALTERGTDARVAGRRVAKEAMANAEKKYPPIAFALFTTPGSEEEYIKGIQDVLGEIPMLGGSASAEKNNLNWKVFCENKTTNDGCAVAIFYTTKKIKNVFANNYNLTKNMGIVTKVEGARKIKEIDNAPALKKYAEWNGIAAEDIMNEKLAYAAISVPVGTKTTGGEATIIHQPIKGNEDYSLEVGSNVSVNTALLQLKTTEDGMIEGVVKAINEVKDEFKTSAILLIHSAGRKKFLDERIDEDFVALKNAIGDIPFIVTFTNSEFGTVDHSGALVANLSLSVTGFSE